MLSSAYRFPRRRSYPYPLDLLHSRLFGTWTEGGSQKPEERRALHIETEREASAIGGLLFMVMGAKAGPGEGNGRDEEEHLHCVVACRAGGHGGGDGEAEPAYYPDAGTIGVGHRGEG